MDVRGRTRGAGPALLKSSAVALAPWGIGLHLPRGYGGQVGGRSWSIGRGLGGIPKNRTDRTYGTHGGGVHGAGGRGIGDNG